MRETVWFVALLFVALTAGCGVPKRTTPKHNFAEKYALHETAEYGDLVERAIGLANVVLDGTEPIRLRMTWKPTGVYPQFGFTSNPGRPGFRRIRSEDTDTCWYENADAVPIYLIDDGLGERENMFVPDGDRCIFINARAIGPIQERFGLGEKTPLGTHYSSFERASVLAAMLLHEVGHLHNGDSGSYTEPTAVTGVDLAPKLIDVSNKEVRADRFAVVQIHNALTSDEWRPFLGAFPGRASTANRLAFVIGVAVNTYDYYNDPWGASDKQSRLNVFNSTGYSHLNLNLRLLIMQYELEPNAIQRSQLKRVVGGAIDSSFAPPAK